jgi:hypothetical protein
LHGFHVDAGIYVKNRLGTEEVKLLGVQPWLASLGTALDDQEELLDLQTYHT